MLKISFLLLVSCCSLPVFGQITIDNTTNSITQLVNGILVPVGSPTVVSNIQFRGCLNISNRYQAGHFSTATTTQTEMGFASGVVLSTGNTADIPLGLGTNPGSVGQMSRNYTSGTAGEIRASNSPAGQDADVANLIAPENYYNGAILEFDFIPLSNEVSFRYVFGSEEYDDQSGSAFAVNYNCSAYNDKFAFLISGPGIAGGQGYQNDALNIARLPNGSEVGINAVNGGLVGSSGGSPNAANCSAANALWLNGSPTTEFNGFIDGTELNGNTNILTAIYSSLTPGLTYHIRLMISDAKDGAYDSVVYLESGSFTTSPIGLPVGFIDLQGECEARGNRIEWKTASEQNNDYFLLESSLDGINFTSLSTVQGMGNSSSTTNYSYFHAGNHSKIIYYRLSQVDFNGNRNILKIISISNDCDRENQAVTASFNASLNQIDFHTTGISGELTGNLYSTLGDIVIPFTAKKIDGSNRYYVSLPMDLAKGIYGLCLTNGGNEYREKILLF
jgi:hypothetical protein